jgi:hypothetical protein
MATALGLNKSRVHHVIAERTLRLQDQRDAVLRDRADVIYRPGGAELTPAHVQLSPWWPPRHLQEPSASILTLHRIEPHNKQLPGEAESGTECGTLGSGVTHALCAAET